MNALLVTVSLISYGYGQPVGYSSQPTISQNVIPYPEIILPARTLPASVGYEIAPVEKSGWVSVEGNVVHPGQYEFFPGMTVNDLIGLGGSFVHQADYEHIQLVREKDHGQTYNISWFQQWQNQVLLQPGDRLIVPDRRFSTL